MTDERAPERYFEDYAPGSVFDGGTLTLSADEIIDFARKYDPQAFHIDPVAAENGPFGGLVASGWHTVSATMRVLVENYLSGASSLGSPGVDDIRWLRPVRPGDVLRVRATVLDSKVSNSKPDRGVVRTKVEALNEADEPVFHMTVLGLVRRRPGEQT
ncbi:MAG TPA: MaoC family dehydratase [Pseudonocardiaceae bacterium]